MSVFLGIICQAQNVAPKAGTADPFANLVYPALPPDLDGFKSAQFLLKFVPVDSTKPVKILTDRQRAALRFMVIQTANIAESVNQKDELLPTSAYIWKVIVLNFPEVAPNGSIVTSIQRENAISVVNLGRILAGRPPRF